MVLYRRMVHIAFSLNRDRILEMVVDRYGQSLYYAGATITAQFVKNELHGIMEGYVMTKNGYLFEEKLPVSFFSYDDDDDFDDGFDDDFDDDDFDDDFDEDFDDDFDEDFGDDYGNDDDFDYNGIDD